MILKVYLAGPFEWKDILSDRAAELRAEGIEVTARWLEEPRYPTAEELDRYAVIDTEDVLAADILVFWDNPLQPRAGRHVEFGMAIAEGYRRTRGYPIFVVGTPANIFHRLPQVHHFSNWEAARARLRAIAKLTLIEA